MGMALLRVLGIGRAGDRRYGRCAWLYAQFTSPGPLPVSTAVVIPSGTGLKALHHP